MNTSRLQGLIAAPFTPFLANGDVNLDVIESYAGMLVRNGVAGVFVCGTTGEGSSLTLDERMRIAERWVAVADGKLKVLVHAGHTCLRDSQALAAHAQALKADGIACVAPYFFKPGLEELVQFSAAVAGAAPALPFYFYHIPSMTGVYSAMLDFLRLAGARIPNLRGVKFTYENLMDFSQCLQLEDGRFEMIFGRDEILIAGLAAGATAAIGSTYNFAAPLYRRVIENFEKNNLNAARADQAKACEMISIFIKYGNLPAGKAMLKMVGIDCGPVRLPLRNVTEEQGAALRGELELAGFFDYCCKVG